MIRKIAVLAAVGLATALFFAACDNGSSGGGGNRLPAGFSMGQALSWGGPGNNGSFRQDNRAPFIAAVTVDNRGVITAASVQVGTGDSWPRMDIVAPAVAALVGKTSVQLGQPGGFDVISGNTVTWNAAQAALNRAVGIRNANFVSPVGTSGEANHGGGGAEAVATGANARAHITGISEANGGPFIAVFPEYEEVTNPTSITTTGSALSWGSATANANTNGNNGTWGPNGEARGLLSVSLTRDVNGFTTAVTYTLGSGDSGPRMTPLLNAAVPSRLVERDSVQLDGISGNTVTWNALQAALNRAAGLADESFVSPVANGGGAGSVATGLRAGANITGISEANGGPFIPVFFRTVAEMPAAE